MLKEIKEIIGLTLIYQINQQQIEIHTAQKTVLGRESFGSNVLSNIFFNGKVVVSRKHCSIEFKENKFYLQDEGSLNGTYYGVNKIDCRNSPQVIENESLVYLGEEPFLARIRFKLPEKIAQNEPFPPQDALKIVRKYKCNESSCNFESETPQSVCPNCDTYNSMFPVYE